MKTILTILFLCGVASATTYYVDPAGSNGNNGLTPQTAWRTLLKVGISTFQPGDVILFKRDGVWNEWLTPPSSGAAGNLDQVRCVWKRASAGVHGILRDHFFAVDEYGRERLADHAERDAADLAVEIRAVRTHLGKCTEHAECAGERSRLVLRPGRTELVCVVGERESGDALRVGDADYAERAER